MWEKKLLVEKVLTDRKDTLFQCALNSKKDMKQYTFSNVNLKSNFGIKWFSSLTTKLSYSI